MDNKLKIINYLGKHNNRVFTMHELSIAIEIPYATFHRTINKMAGLVNMQKIGKSKTISLNKGSAAVKPYLAISSEEEKKEYLKKQPIISKIASELNTDNIVVLFGSYAKGTEDESSDVDILIINKDGNSSLSFSKYELLFKKKINPIFFTKSEFKRMLRENGENVGRQALKSHIILNNSEGFWEEVLHA